jgi:hypothetical protein
MRVCPLEPYMIQDTDPMPWCASDLHRNNYAAGVSGVPCKRKEPVGSYCCYIWELTRGTRRLFAEVRAKLAGEFSDPEELREAVAVWSALQADRVNADA